MVENQRKCQRKRMLKPGICTQLCQELPAPPTNNVLLSSAICNDYSFGISFLTENDRLCMWCLCLTFGMKSYTTPGPTKNGQSLPACPTQSVVKQPSESKAKIFCHTVPTQHIVLRNSPCSVIACVVRFLCPPSRLAGNGTCSGLQASGLAASFNGGKTTK